MRKRFPATLLLTRGLTFAAAADAFSCSEDAGPKSDVNGAKPSENGLSIRLTDGPLEGDSIGGSRRFLKIPYAKPPLGELRFKAPFKNDPWTAVRHEANFSAGCAQAASAGSIASANEDCLYLNVWAPENPPAKVPVMVWFHGGGNFAGSAGDLIPGTQQLWFDGQFLASRQGVVVVTSNYRLGPLGFFSHPALASEGGPRGNQGLWDQRRVLEWVRDNIAMFGGDAKNVTIFGESAGSADVCYHVASPQSRGLFHRAISESGGCTARTPIPERAAETAAGDVLAFADALGCPPGPQQLSCLRAVPVDRLIEKSGQPDPTTGTTGGTAWPFGVVVDGAEGFLPEQPRALFDSGKVAKVPYIFGSNSDEGTLFLLRATVPQNNEQYRAALEQRYGSFTPDVLALYPADKFGNDYRAALARVIGDSSLVCGTHDSARRAVKAGLDVFMYNFNVPWSLAPSLLHASHAAEISHAFGNPLVTEQGTQLAEDSQRVADQMSAYWAHFAHSGNPNHDGAKAAWPRFSPDPAEHDQRLQIDPEWRTLDDFRKDECALWRRYYEL